ncbi:alpha/beta fold hydrolase, partial [Nocardioides stalactiti]|uniref:alpha/beta fold hydrolase n=1 Tax=Nocardioides stalactiti TaxID=2755356 RepID=UPI0015FF2C2C
MGEGHITFRDHRVWYRVVGEDRGKPPLLLIHGGPGSTSHLLTPLAALADTGRQVVFYDQLGAGRSDRTHDPALWTLETFVDEVQAVRDHLGLDDVHVLGHSWGGMLALEHALRQPAGLRSLVLVSALVSAPLFATESARLVAQLPTLWRRVLTHRSTDDEPAVAVA